jgi:hypothetical protein
VESAVDSDGPERMLTKVLATDAWRQFGMVLAWIEPTLPDGNLKAVIEELDSFLEGVAKRFPAADLLAIYRPPVQHGPTSGQHRGSGSIVIGETMIRTGQEGP